MYSEILVEGKLACMDKLEDAIPTLPSGWGESSRADQLAMLPSLPPEQQTIIKEHWAEWDRLKNNYESVFLVPGGEEGVKQYAEEWRAEQAKRAEKNAKRRANRKSGKGGESSGDHRLSAFHCSMQLDAENFIGWTDEELATLQAAQDGDIRPYLEVVLARLDKVEDCEVTGFYGIMHDKDEQIVDYDDDGRPVYDKKVNHVHISCKFASRNKGLTIAHVAEAIGIAENFIEKPKGRWGWANLLAYLIHAKDIEKYQYPPDEVITLRGDDYLDIEKRNRLKWAKGFSKRTTDTAKEDIDWVIDQITKGKLTMKQILLDDQLMAMYARQDCQGKIKAAFTAYEELRSFTSAEELRSGMWSKLTIMLYGPAGCGKTLMVNTLIPYLERAYGWHVDRLADGHMTDGLHGAEIVVMDDVRSGTYESQRQFLNFHDPHNPAELGARYNNKSDVAPHVILQTSNVDPMQMLYYLRGQGTGDSKTEALDQALRRYSLVIQFYPFNLRGYYNCVVFAVKRLAAPVKKTFKVDDRNGISRNVEIEMSYALQQVGEAEASSPFDAFNKIIRLIDDCAAMSEVANRSDGEQVFASGLEMLNDAMKPAIEAGNLPPMPDYRKVPLALTSSNTDQLYADFKERSLKALDAFMVSIGRTPDQCQFGVRINNEPYIRDTPEWMLPDKETWLAKSLPSSTTFKVTWQSEATASVTIKIDRFVYDTDLAVDQSPTVPMITDGSCDDFQKEA